MTCAAKALRRAISASFVNFRGLATYEELERRDWASLTFCGERHCFRLALQGDGAQSAADHFLDGLAEREFDLQGHILIDIAVTGDRRNGDAVTLDLEALTVMAD